MFGLLKKIFFWSYGRSTWQYDILCVLILAFIFLTPKVWFDNSERDRQVTHQTRSTAAKMLLVWPEDSATTPDAGQLEQRARSLAGRDNARVTNPRPVRDERGKVIAYEVDIE